MKRAIFAAVLSVCLLPAARASDIPARYAERIADAIYRAENSRHYPYGIIAPHGRRLDAATARRWCLNTIRHNWHRWEADGCPGEYLVFLARRYAPLDAANDPHGLNQHWLKNVRWFLNH